MRKRSAGNSSRTSEYRRKRAGVGGGLQIQSALELRQVLSHQPGRAPAVTSRDGVEQPKMAGMVVRGIRLLVQRHGERRLQHELGEIALEHRVAAQRSEAAVELERQLEAGGAV